MWNQKQIPMLSKGYDFNSDLDYLKYILEYLNFKAHLHIRIMYNAG